MKKQNKIPRILALKLQYGDDFIDYIKDEYGVDNFVRDVLAKEDEKTHFLRDNQHVKEFSSHWIILTDFYKERFGKSVRDRDAINSLIKIRGFKSLSQLYDFRCELFKADFKPDDRFKKRLAKNLIELKKITHRLLEQKRKRNEYLINNKEW